MLPSESPFQCHWWGTSLENAGEVRPDVGTYGRYEFERLPPLHFEMRGHFKWLAAALTHEHSIKDERATENAKALPLLGESSARLGIQLPTAFINFAQATDLQERVRSNTDCFFDLSSEPVRSPVGSGYLIRFLADSQGCIFWYLYLTEDGSDHAVGSSPEFFATAEEQWQEELPDPRDIVYSAESFEVFMCRFWLENEIWYAEWKKTPMPDVGREYVERYRAKGSSA